MKLPTGKVTGRVAAAIALAVSMLVGVEGISTKSYKDTGGVWTICYGYTHGVVANQTATREQCWTMLKSEATATANAITPYLPSDLNPNQLAALISFCYNVGVGNCRESTLFRLLKAGDYDGAAKQFKRWHYVKGKDCYVKANNCSGIPKRRATEERMFLMPYTIAQDVNDATRK